MTAVCNSSHIPMPELSIRDIWRFGRYVESSVATVTSACWEWTGNKRANRGIFALYGRTYSAPRLAWFMANGSDPEQLEVCHRCDNPRCVNPAHLFLATHVENMRDMVDKGRCGSLPQTICKRGHQQTGANVYIRRNGYRFCRVCAQMRARAAWHKNQAARKDRVPA